MLSVDKPRTGLVRAGSLDEVAAPPPAPPAPANEPAKVEEKKAEEQKAPVDAEVQNETRKGFANDPTAAALQKKLLAQTQQTQQTQNASKCGPGCSCGCQERGLVGNRGEAANDVGALPGPRPASSTFKDVDQGIAALEKDFGVRIQKDITPAWDVESVSRVHEAWSQMKPAERDALKGAVVKREVFDPEDKTVAGRFEANGTRGDNSKGPTITFFNNAFPTKGKDAENRRASMQIALHEAGHALEQKDVIAPTRVFNEKMTKLQEAMANEKTAVPAANQAMHAWDAQKRTDKKPSKAAIDFDNKSNAVIDATTALINAGMDKNTKNADKQKALDAAEVTLQKAIAARDEAFKKLPADDKLKSAADDYKTALDARTASALAWKTATKDVLVAETALNSVVAVRDDPRTEKSEQKSKKLVEFEKGGGAKPVSDYGKTSAHENFAEAYALYRRDPAYLEKNFKAVYDRMKALYP